MEYYVSKIAMVSSVYGQRQFGDRQAIFFAMTIGISIRDGIYSVMDNKKWQHLTNLQKIEKRFSIFF